MKPLRPTARTRLLVLTADYPPHTWSGVGTAVARQCRALAEQGAEVDVLVARPGADGAPALGPSGHPRLRLHALRAHAPLPVEPSRYDWLHLHALGLSALALALCRPHAVRLACTVHGLVHREPYAHAHPEDVQAWSRLQVALWRRADRVVFLSGSEREEALALAPDLAPRAHVIPNGLPPPAAVPPAAGRRHGPLLFAGRYARSKGLSVLAGAVPHWVASHPGGVVFLGGHGDADGRATVAALTRRFPGRCVDLGWVHGHTLTHWLRQAALVLVPSEYEPFGQVALEAMAAGAPVLAADVGGLREVVGPGSGGLRLASRHPEDWAREALRLVGDEALHTRLSAEGPRFVARHFAIHDVARRLLEDVYTQGASPSAALAEEART